MTKDGRRRRNNRPSQEAASSSRRRSSGASASEVGHRSGRRGGEAMSITSDRDRGRRSHRDRGGSSKARADPPRERPKSEPRRLLVRGNCHKRSRRGAVLGLGLLGVAGLTDLFHMFDLVSLAKVQTLLAAGPGHQDQTQFRNFHQVRNPCRRFVPCQAVFLAEGYRGGDPQT